LGVQEVCGARFTRLAAALEIEGAVVEIALDRGILTGGGKEIPLCEIEVELKDGSDAAAIAFADALAEKYGLTAEHRSKYRRALTLAKEI
jgi:triphosphatase